ncbi:Ig-like domain-containing protein [Myxococcota bacterium]|nr:Ig-like domain-containing protein [Myxococcota bacterium]
MVSKRLPLVLTLGAAVSTACGAEVPSADPVPQDRVDLHVATLSTPRIRPQGITLEAPWEHARASGSIDSFVGRPPRGLVAWAGPGQPPLPIFLNRNGGTYSPGQDDSRFNTSIVPNRQSTVSAYAGSNAQWQQIVDCITEMFAPYNVVITETEPAGGEYVESVIGGRPGQLGLPNGVGGVAPIDSFNCSIIPNAIVFTFAEVVGNAPQESCEIAAQEIAHAFSLDHEYYCPDPMTYLSGCGDKTFRDYDAQCGEYSPRACNCNRARQNSVQTLIQKLGTNTGQPPPPPPNDPTPPTVTVNSPANNATLPQDSTIQVSATVTDNIQVSAVELVWSFNNSVFACPGQSGGGAVSCTVSGSNYTWSIRVGQGARTFQVRAYDTAGNVTTSPARTINLGMGTPPPNDTVPPTASITSPADGATLLANSTIQVVATASDDQGLGSVELVWNFASDAFPCPFNGQGISCTESNGTYTWSLNVGVGTRSFSVRAVDLAGNIFETPQRSITLDSSTEPPPNPGTDIVGEENDVAADAFPARCGNAIDLVVVSNDEDWFAFDAPSGTNVEVSISATAGSVIGLQLFADDGTTMLAEQSDVLGAGGAVTALSQGPRILARVTTTSMTPLGYRLTTLCSAEPPPPPPPGDDTLEDNDDASSATRTACDAAQPNLVAQDPDYFVVEVPAGESLHVVLTGSGARVSVLDMNGNELAPAGNEARTPNLPGGDVLVKIEPTTAGSSYGFGLECAPLDPGGETPDPRADGVGGGCTSVDTRTTGASLLVVALFGLILAVRRRR